jgi:hypothetical protein
VTYINVLSKIFRNLVKLLKDSNVEIRTATLKSLYFIAVNNPNYLVPYINEDFLKSICNCTVFDKQLIAVIDYGVKI